jgi:hypothetical protein
MPCSSLPSPLRLWWGDRSRRLFPPWREPRLVRRSLPWYLHQPPPRSVRQPPPRQGQLLLPHAPVLPHHHLNSRTPTLLGFKGGHLKRSCRPRLSRCFNHRHSTVLRSNSLVPRRVDTCSINSLQGSFTSILTSLVSLLLPRCSNKVRRPLRKKGRRRPRLHSLRHCRSGQRLISHRLSNKWFLNRPLHLPVSLMHQHSRLWLRRRWRWSWERLRRGPMLEVCGQYSRDKGL